MMTESFTAIQTLLDQALRLAKQEGHSWVRNEHVALIITRNRPELLEALPDHIRSAFDEHTLTTAISTFPREFHRPHITSEMRELFADADADDVLDPVQTFCILIAEAIQSQHTAAEGTARAQQVPIPSTTDAANHDDPAPPEPPTDPSEPDPQTGDTAPIGTDRDHTASPPAAAPTPPPTDTPAPIVHGRESIADSIFTAFAMKYRRSVLIVSPEGGGRSAIVHALAQRIGEAPADSPIKNYTLHQLDLGLGTPGSARSALETAVNDSDDQDILFIDNFEVGASFEGLRQVDIGVLETLEQVTHRTDRKVVVTLDEKYLPMLAQAASLAERFEVISLPELTAKTLRQIAEYHAEGLGRYHNITIGPDVIDDVVTPKRAHERGSHPSLALYRMDRIAAHLTLFGEQQPVANESASTTSTRFDPDAVVAQMRHDIHGQDEAIERVVNRLRVTRVNLDSRPHRPDGVFLLAGPTGVGKTAFSLSLAKHLFGSAESVVRLDMSEYSEPHTVSKLVGSPPGYVGSDEPSQWLTTRILENPNVVLLLDEVEKAHPTVWQTFLQVFDAGRLTDSRGATADFRETVIALTTNLGASTFANRSSVGFGSGAPLSTDAEDSGVLRAIRERMMPELINRFDDVLVFRPLDSAAVERIAQAELDAVRTRFAERGYDITFSAEVVSDLTQRGYSREYGARPILRLIEAELIAPLSRQMPGPYRVGVRADGAENAEPFTIQPA